MEQYQEITEDFRKEFKESSYKYSDEFLYGLIAELTERVEYLEKKYESDGK